MKFSLALIMSVGVIATSTATHAVTIDLAPNATDAVKAAAHGLATSLVGSIWSIECEPSSSAHNLARITFDSTSKITLNPTWNGFDWAVVGARQVRMVQSDGQPHFFRFADDQNTFQFLDWEFNRCIGKRSK